MALWSKFLRISLFISLKFGTILLGQVELCTALLGMDNTWASIGEFFLTKILNNLPYCIVDFQIQKEHQVSPLIHYDNNNIYIYCPSRGHVLCSAMNF